MALKIDVGFFEEMILTPIDFPTKEIPGFFVPGGISLAPSIGGNSGDRRVIGVDSTIPMIRPRMNREMEDPSPTPI